ncbi:MULTISPECIES: hypothetical protein [Photorhabdus]|uniref:DUF2262 domain-containing protein n=2 Tax=Photorhabdus TaxID=29487 RepID=A0AAW6BPD1_9GAMM|nr:MULTISPECIES: hypothetical protein [Photorhabdus]EYU16562.1 hypothetical protein BA1DRAFT_00846 [Photorhabdus aegyptia]MDB6373864.1 hypothetical protein [Photorhabdus bodei]
MNNFCVKNWTHKRNMWWLNKSGDIVKGISFFVNNNEQIHVNWQFAASSKCKTINITTVDHYELICLIPAKLIAELPTSVGTQLMNTIKLVDTYYDTRFDKVADIESFNYCHDDYSTGEYSGAQLEWNAESVHKAREILAVNPLINFIDLECDINFEKIDFCYDKTYLRIFHSKAYSGFFEKYTNIRYEAEVTDLVLLSEE